MDQEEGKENLLNKVDDQKEDDNNSAGELDEDDIDDEDYDPEMKDDILRPASTRSKIVVNLKESQS